MQSSTIPTSEQALLTIKFLFAIFALRCTIVYSFRLLLHPLRSYPGPFLAKISDWYGAYHALRRRLHIATYEDHKKYGTVIRQGPNKLVFNSVQAVHDVLQNERLLKSKMYLATRPNPSSYNIFNIVDKQIHRARRRIVGQGMNKRAVHRFDPVLQEQVTIFLRHLLDASMKDQAVDMSERCGLLGLDISGELGFGRSFDLQTDTRNAWMSKGIETQTWRLNTYVQFPAIRYSGWEKLLLPVVLPQVRRYHRMIKDMIDARLCIEKDARPDLFASVSDFKDPQTGEGIDKLRLFAEANFLISAAGDTVKSLMSAVFFYLSRHPEVYRRLANEIRTTFADVEEIIHDPKLLRCTYLRACLEETLRISPPVGATLWRDVPAGDVPADADTNPVIIDGHVIPPGTQVGVNVYCIHHNEAYFASSFAFRPERWLPEESGLSAEETKVMNSAFLPFSKGPRNCAGVALAYTEASVVLAKTLWYFDFEIDERDVASAEKNRPLVFHMEDQMGSWHTGPLLKFRPRGDAWRGL